MSKISAQAQLNITESKLRPDKNTRVQAQNKFMLLVKRKKKKNKTTITT